jgi:hypothetical protein
MDTLIGAEIGRVWDDGQGTVYATVYMDREKTAAVYTELIHANLQDIDELTAMGAAEKNTFDGYARYKLAAVLAALNAQYAQIISYAAGPAALTLKTPASYELEASNIIRGTTVTVDVEGDRANRIRDAFAGVLSAEGMRTRGNNPPYVLEVTVGFSEVRFPNNTMIYCRAEVSANLVETAAGAVLLPFAFAERVGHGTYPGAEASAVRAIEKIIGEKYPALLREYLAGLLPGRR